MLLQYYRLERRSPDCLSNACAADPHRFLVAALNRPFGEVDGESEI